MNQNKLLTIALLLYTSTACLAQSSINYGLIGAQDKKRIKKFMASTTYVVLEGNHNSLYNKAIKEAVEKYWKVTPYAFISREEYSARQDDYYDNKNTDASNNYLLKHIIKISNKYGPKVLPYYYEILELDWNYERISSVAMRYLILDGDTLHTEYLYKLPIFVQHLNNYPMEYEANPHKGYTQMRKQLDAKSVKLKSKTLLVLPEDLSKDCNTIETLRKDYPYKIKISPIAEIKKAIEEEDPNVAFLHSYNPFKDEHGNTFQLMIFTAKGGEMLFYAIDFVNRRGKIVLQLNGLSPKHLKYIAKLNP